MSTTCKIYCALAAAVFLVLCAAAAFASEEPENITVIGGFLKKSPLSDAEQRRVLDAVKLFPNQNEWVMFGDGSVYSMVLRPIQQDSRENVRIKLDELARNAAALRVRYLLYLRASPPERRGAYKDEDALASALAAWDEGSGKKLAMRSSATNSSGKWAFSIAVAPDDSFGELSRRVETMEEAEARTLDLAYCGIIYPKARAMYEEKRYKDALLFYRELHKLKWARPDSYLEAADCFVKTGLAEDAKKLVTETINELGGEMDSKSMEFAGDLLFELGDETGAIEAYRASAEKMRGEL
jgi:predicted negative regulator of RcsB-dependent stress response